MVGIDSRLPGRHGRGPLILAWSGYCGLQAMLRCLVVFIPTVIPTVVLTFVAAGIGIACIEDKRLRAVLYILVVLLGAPFVVVPVVATIWGGKFLAMSLGDVARYFSTSPAVIRENDSIRAQARKLIEELHDRLSPTFPKTRRSDFGTRASSSSAIV